MPIGSSHKEAQKEGRLIRITSNDSIVPATDPAPATHFLAFLLASTPSSDALLTRTNHPLTGLLLHPRPPTLLALPSRPLLHAPPVPGRSSPLNHDRHRELETYLAGAITPVCCSQSGPAHTLHAYTQLAGRSAGKASNHYPDRARTYVLFVEADMCRPHGCSRHARSVVRTPLFSLFKKFPPAFLSWLPPSSVFLPSPALGHMCGNA